MTFQILLIVVLLSFMFYTMWKDKKTDRIEAEKLEQQRIAASRKVSYEELHNPKISYREKLKNLHYLQMKEDRDTVRSLSFNTEDLLLTELLLHYNSDFGYLIQSLTIVNNSIAKIDDQAEIRNYKVLDAIICDKNFTCSQALILIRYINIDTDESDSFTASMTLEAKEENDECLIVRATTTIPPIDRQGLRAVPHAFSVMLSMDKMGKGQKQAYFDYMLKEALNANSDNLYTLNPIQLEMISQQNPSPARDIFFGNKYFSEKRYYNALLHLEKAYEKMRPVFFGLNDYWKRTFFDVCYKIGFCYSDMENYSNAIYYLELAEPMKYITYTTEYVNALVNSGDVRAIYIIDQTLETVQKQISDMAANGREVDENIAVFYNFLKRRKGYSLIDIGNLNSAEELFRQMLNESNNHDFALNELRHIAELREQQKAQDETAK